LNCYWRTDGEPLWTNPALVADEQTRYPVTEDTARRFLMHVAQVLRVDSKHVFPAYEDAFYYLWREGRLPVNVDPFDSRLADPMERARLAKIFEQGLDQVIGHVLPIARTAQGDRWQTGSWFLRGGRCCLVPGDSPIGYRLPLESQPWVAAADYPFIHAPDPSRSLSALPPHAEIRRQFREQDFAETHAAPEPPVPVTRTFMCAEPRNGVLYIFMPPAGELDHYVELLAAVEAAAQALEQPIILEGYEPPNDARISNFRVTPDPGVIEVNIHPSATWDQLSERTTFLYEAARESRLTSEKFMLDGRHTGTGGGNHIVLGGASAPDSPFLRRPDLLRSLLSYWHNHPSLSYLFSGMFIGPTSQAPRVDEARNDSLYELEIAFRQFPPPGASAPPWLVDRLLRNLLIDVSGNTHRTEFCIDKLYSPDGPTGRLGLLEMRAFEMPPHPRMSLAQQLVLRAMVARFWRKPYAPESLVRWGTELHDRFLMPHFVEQDFADVIEEMQREGFALQSGWFAPHFEFRFPKYGDFAVRGMQLELRHALEPWHVMGEEGSPGGTVRYVDSSVERLQVKVCGLAPDRYLVTCNGRAVPMQPTGTAGEFVGAVRYRAWQPPSALHPTIGVDAPLTFDLFDSWMSRSQGGCQYHVTHPGGLTHEKFPVNSFEAESRRLARFFRMGHTPGKMTVAPAAADPEFPWTLDLRK
jgi:uncharacterized protein (DUF2126 family)